MNPRTERMPCNPNLPPGFEYPEDWEDEIDDEWDYARDAYQEGTPLDADGLEADHGAKSDETGGVGKGI